MKGLSPQYLLFYIGLNDSQHTAEKNFYKEAGHDGHTLNPERIQVFFDTIKSRSYLYDSIRIFKFKYLPRKGFVKYDGKTTSEYKKKFNFISYKFAKNNYNLENLEKKYKIEIKNYIARVEKLIELSEKLNSTPIFITNIASFGHTEKLFALNNSLIKNCKIKKISCIDLAKKIDGKIEYWYDGAHTSKKGSEYISNLIYEDLKNLIK